MAIIFEIIAMLLCLWMAAYTFARGEYIGTVMCLMIAGFGGWCAVDILNMSH